MFSVRTIIIHVDIFWNFMIPPRQAALFPVFSHVFITRHQSMWIVSATDSVMSVSLASHRLALDSHYYNAFTTESTTRPTDC